MAEKAPPHQTPDQNNVLVYVSEYENVALQTAVVNSCRASGNKDQEEEEAAAAASEDQKHQLPIFYRSINVGVACDSNSVLSDGGGAVGGQQETGHSIASAAATMVCVTSPTVQPHSASLPPTHNQPLLSSSDFKTDYISPPYGWKRLLSNGIILYLSPSNAVLSSLDQVRSYLQSDGTCKCGLECPLHISLAFSFDPKVLTKPCPPPTIGAVGDLTKLCNHKRKLLSSLENTNSDGRFATVAAGSGFDPVRRKKRRIVVSNLPAAVLQNRIHLSPRLPLDVPVQQGVKIQQQQIMGSEGWREDTIINGFAEYNGGSANVATLSGIVQNPNSLVAAQSIGGLSNGIPELHPVQGTFLPDVTGVTIPDPQIEALSHGAIQIQSGPSLTRLHQSAGPQPYLQQPSGGHASHHLLQQVQTLQPTSVLQQQATVPISSSNQQSIQISQLIQNQSQSSSHGQSIIQQSNVNQNLVQASPVFQRQSGHPIQETLVSHGIQHNQNILNVLPAHSQASHPVSLNHCIQPVVSTTSVVANPIPSSGNVQISRRAYHQNLQPPSYSLQQQQLQLEGGRSVPASYSIKYGSKSGTNTIVQSAHGQNASSIQSVSASFHQTSQQTLSAQQQNQQQILTSHQQISNQVLSTHQQTVTAHQLPSSNSSNSPSSSLTNISSAHLNTVNSETNMCSINRTRTPPWHQNKQSVLDRHAPPVTWTKKSKPLKEGGPSFLEDPSGYLAQQTAMLRQVVAGREDEEPRTMASSHTTSSNTLTSVLAGRTNTLTVSVGSQEPAKPPPPPPPPQQQHILVSNNGQFIITTTSPKVSPPSPLLLPAPLVLQPIDSVQLPQLVVPPVIHEDLVEKRKSPNKKRKMSPTTSTAMLLSPQPQQQVLTILPSKSPITNMIQPLNVVQNIPIQQFIVPSMVVPDGTILQSTDTVQLNLVPAGTGVFSGGQNLLTSTGVVLRAPTTSQPQQQQPKFLHSPNQFVNFSGELSPVVPNTSNTTVVQQNTTTIVQQTTMVQQPSPSYIVDKPNFILTSDKANFILSPSGSSTSSEKTTKSTSSGSSCSSGNSGSSFVRNSVSTQTQNQGLAVSSSGSGLVVSVASSPPDTTTLSPADAEVTTSVTSPDPSMVQCVSSTNLSDDAYCIDTTTPISYSSGKPVTFVESSTSSQPLQDKDITQIDCEDYSMKIGLCSTTSDSNQIGSIQESD